MDLLVFLVVANAFDFAFGEGVVFVDELVEVSLELVDNLLEFFLTGVQLLVFEVFSGPPVAAVLAVDLELGAVELEVVGDAFESLDLFLAAETLDLEALALVVDVLFKVFQVDALSDHVFTAFVQHFDLTDHGFEQFVLDRLVDLLDDLHGFFARACP